jgi:cyclic pyranopterin phosphate synthase
MPEAEYVWLPKQSILTSRKSRGWCAFFRVAGRATQVRLTGGEPLLRHDLPTLAAMLAPIPGVRDLALTTQRRTLAKHAHALRGRSPASDGQPGHATA